MQGPTIARRLRDQNSTWQVAGSHELPDPRKLRRKPTEGKNPGEASVGTQKAQTQCTEAQRRGGPVCQHAVGGNPVKCKPSGRRTNARSPGQEKRHGSAYVELGPQSSALVYQMPFRLRYFRLRCVKCPSSGDLRNATLTDRPKTSRSSHKSQYKRCIRRKTTAALRRWSLAQVSRPQVSMQAAAQPR